MGPGYALVSADSDLSSCSCGEFGWRGDAAKWPDYFEDSVEPVRNVGPGSPSGIAFGYGTSFPAKYQHALFACDWTFATIHAIHLTPTGASYRAKIEEFVGGNGLPVTDLVIGADGALYFLVGGRRLNSALYRVTYVGDQSTDGADLPSITQPSVHLHSVRKRLEAHCGTEHPLAVADASEHLGHDDRLIRFTARTAIESQPVGSWRDRVLDAKGRAKLVGLLGLARKEHPKKLSRVVEELNQIETGNLASTELIILLRGYELALARSENEIHSGEKQEIAARLRNLFPHQNGSVNRELIRILCYLTDKSMIDPLLEFMAADLGERPVLGGGYFTRNPKYGKAVRDMLQSAPLLDRMHVAQMLLWMDDGWTKQQRANYFRLIVDAIGNSRGGHSYVDMWNRIREVAIDQTPEPWREEMESIAEQQLAPADNLPTPQGPGENWTLDELLSAAEKGFRNRNYQNGKTMFAAAKCVTCHRFNGEGGATGPDLSSLGQRFTIRDILDSTLHPSKAISDQYRVTMLTLSDGRTISGRIVSRNNERLSIATNLNRPSQSTSISLSEIEAEHLTPVSTMPDGLLDPLNRDEVLDLLAYLYSGGYKQHPVFGMHQPESR